MGFKKRKVGFFIVFIGILLAIKAYRSSQGSALIEATEVVPVKPKVLSKQLSGPLPLPVSAEHNFLQGTLEEISFPVQYTGDCYNERITRYGTLLRVPNARATIVVCHGFMCDKRDVGIIRMLFRWSKYPYNIMTFDFRGHGEKCAEQECTMGKNEPYDIKGAVRYLKSNPALAKLPLLAYGFSMGAVSLIEAQAKFDNLFDALLLDCPFDATTTVLKRVLERLRIRILGYELGLPAQNFFNKYVFNEYIQSCVKFFLRSSSKFDTQNVDLSISPVTPAESARAITVPAYIITCSNDEKVPVESVKAVYDNLTGYKRLWVTNGRRHFDSFFYNPEEYTYRVVDFVERFLEGALEKDEQEGVVYDQPDNHTLSIAAYRAEKDAARKKAVRNQNEQILIEEIEESSDE